MNWDEALEVVVARGAHERYRELCHGSHPQHEQWREIVIRKATDLPPSPYPPAPRMAANLGRSLFDWAVSGFSMASEEEQARRLEICAACPQWDGSRCRICGCYTAAKVRLRTEHCPLPEPKW